MLRALSTPRSRFSSEQKRADFWSGPQTSLLWVLVAHKELIANLNYNEESPGNAGHFADALSYIRSKVTPGDLWFATAMQRALRSAPWLRDAIENPLPSEDTEPEVALLTDRANATIVDQIAANIGSDPIDRMVIISPYWDMKLEGLSRLRANLGMPPADLLIDADTTYFPKSELPRLTDVELFRVAASDNKRFRPCKTDHCAGAILGSRDIR